MALRIERGDFSDQRVIDLLAHHHATCHAVTPKGSAHALDLSGLQSPDIQFSCAWSDTQLLGIGALKRLDSINGEIKSMHTSQAARRQGVASKLLIHLISEARAMGLQRVSLETGSFAFFAPAVALYRAHGFVDCAPFGSYNPDPNSLFLTLALA
jgi:putative acetyltransferase